VTIYLDEEIEKRMTANAIRAKLVDEWPENVRELAGSWEDSPTLGQIGETDQRDITRETL
jgi:DNA-binding NtrC family response regulator